MNLPRQQQRNTKLIPLFLHLYILLPIIKRTCQIYTIPTIIPYKFSQDIIITICGFYSRIFGIVVVVVTKDYILEYDVPMKFIYFERLLFLNDDFELGLPIFFMFELLLYA